MLSVLAVAAAAAALAVPAPALRIDGPAAGAHFGASVAGAGDVNGDGYADIVVGSPLGLGVEACAGAAYVLFGPFAPGTLDLGTQPLRGMHLVGGRCREFAGTSVAGAGDVSDPAWRSRGSKPRRCAIRRAASPRLSCPGPPVAGGTSRCVPDASAQYGMCRRPPHGWGGGP